ncbi:alcohol dehydrogenase [Bradyrhizobium macuxiense]|uniref:Alcohol dehydrogenase n=2 Tax=Bradyrhizobium macuxiense TaxID=1755647 RepID=A0A120FL87_9BRAD|nr:alcohol dehydrogenase [Bradyrhizobium macuxiense]
MSRRAMWLRTLVLLLPLFSAGSVTAGPDNYVDIARGKALVIAGDCAACHTAEGGQPFAGGLALQTPFGAIMTPNITFDTTTGIGSWSADDFARAMQEGRRPGGGHLYPAFPYPYYTKVERSDLDAIYLYLRALPPVENRVNRNTLPFPFNIRLLMKGWNALFFTSGTFKPDPARSAEFNRGAYLVEGLGHCGACHTPFNAFGANQNDKYLEGNQIDNWTAPNITNDPRVGLGKWSVDDIVQYLKTGQNAFSLASGPMKDAIENSTSEMPVADLKAIAVYLKERGAEGPPASTPLAASDPRMQAGEAIYVDTCAACHVRTGTGVAHLFPKLAGNVVTTQEDPASLIRIVIAGGRAAATEGFPTSPAMPSLGYRLSDKQVADVVTYVRNSWGNAAAPVSEETVRTLRAKVTGAAPGE